MSDCKNIILEEGENVYFASDFHLGVDHKNNSSVERERKIIEWLCDIEKKTSHIFFLGDIFDFWFEYKKVIPKGFSRFQGKLSALCDAGKQIYIFSGNHDVWYFDYFLKEIGVKYIFRKPTAFIISGKKFLLGHGDSLGKVSFLNKMMRWGFHSPILQSFFSYLHPDIGIPLASQLSKNSRKKHTTPYFNEEKDNIYLYCKEKSKIAHYDYYLFGHNHYPYKKSIKNGVYINIGDWLYHHSYAFFDGKQVSLQK